MPPRPQVTSPSSLYVQLDRAQGLTVSWLALPEIVWIRVDEFDDARPSYWVRVECEFDGMAGAGTVPPSLMARLEPSDGSSLNPNLVIATRRCSRQFWAAFPSEACATWWATFQVLGVQ